MTDRIEPMSDDKLNRGGLPELRSELARVLSVDPNLPLADLVHAARVAVIERREAREWCDRHLPLLESARQPYRSSQPPSIRPPLWSSIDTGIVNPYTCRLLKRIDAMLWRLRGRRVCWLNGTLCERMPAGHGVELRSHFPDRWFVWAADVQDRRPWTRRLLSI